MGSWNIGINSEGKDSRSQDAKRRALEAREWTSDKIKNGIITSMVSGEKTEKAQLDTIDEVTAYAGAAATLVRFLEEDMDAAIKEFNKAHAGALSDQDLEVHKVKIMTFILKEMMDGVEEIRKI